MGKISFMVAYKVGFMNRCGNKFFPTFDSAFQFAQGLCCVSGCTASIWWCVYNENELLNQPHFIDFF